MYGYHHIYTSKLHFLHSWYTMSLILQKTCTAVLNYSTRHIITCTNFQRECIILAWRVIDVSVWFVRGRSTVDLSVSQWHWNTRRVIETYIKVHQTTAAQQMSALRKHNHQIWHLIWRHRKMFHMSRPSFLILKSSETFETTRSNYIQLHAKSVKLTEGESRGDGVYNWVPEHYKYSPKRKRRRIM